ncbi:MAG: DUF2336 domain-containing protein [Rhodospirillales bacterium]|nr:DUF2336 domain-containing protein [Rhodospirillales bacterium]
MLKGLLEKFRKGSRLDYEEAKQLAQSNDVKVREELAQKPNVQPEILYFLAQDRAASVRTIIAKNDATPHHADLLLTNDADESVRGVLATKIAALAPGLTAHEVDNLRRMTYEALEKLARDQAVKVRQVVAETLQDMADAPPEVIRRLAEDTELVVCAPVLENLPVLTDRDLIQIINLNPVDGAISAISQRKTLPDEVMEEIFASNDIAAVATLLGNSSVSIKENLLERICDKSRTVKSLQEPMIHRPQLPKAVALRLADFVADHLIKALLNRKDLDPAIADAVRQEVSTRLDIAAEEEAAAEHEAPYAKAKRLHGEGRLEPQMVNSALKAGQREYAMAALAVLANVSMRTVETVSSAGSAKGLVALSWKAGLESSVSVTVQQRLGRVQPKNIIQPKNGEYSMSSSEMEWQLEFLRD